MSIRAYGISIAVAVLAAWTYATPAEALTMQECSVKYKAAQGAGTLGGMKWNDFRKAQCGSDASAATAPAPAAVPAPAARATTGSASQTPIPAPAPAAAAAAGAALFPTAVSPKYATMSAGKARMQTCLEQYDANKASNRNGGLKWIQKGGGYYSECNNRLKGG